MQLAEQKCEACEAGVGPLSHDEVLKIIQQTPGWEAVENRIERTFHFPDFMAAVRFADKVADIAEEQNHHPDLHISWGKVRVELSTHKVGGLSHNDFILAAKINRMVDIA